MICKACMGVVVWNETGLSFTIFSSSGDRMAQKMSLYI